MREIGVRADAVVERRQDAADGTRVDAAVGVPAHAAIDRAGVETRPTTDALEALAERRRENSRAAVVEQHEMELLGPVELSFAARAGDERGVDRDVLTAGGPGQQLEKDR